MAVDKKKIPKFGTFIFDEARGIFNATMREMSPAERDLTILGNSGTSGMSILRGRRKGKLVAVNGIVLKDTVADLVTEIRDMTKLLMAESIGSVPQSTLQFETDDGTWAYEKAVLLNPESLFQTEEAHTINWTRFQALFFCPTGVPRSTTLTTVNFSNITTTPFSDAITINGTAEPEVLIAITFDLASTIDEFTFTNITTGDQITVTGLDISDDDVVFIDNVNKEVRFNTTKVAFTGIFPSFLPGVNNWQLAVAGSGNITEEQTTFDDEEKVFGVNWFSQEFQVQSNESISQIALFLKQVSTPALAVYDNFNDNSFDTALWTSNGSAAPTEQNNRLELLTTAPSGVNVTSDDTDFDGVKFDIAPLTGGSSGELFDDHFFELAKPAGLAIRVYLHIQAGNSIIRVDGVDVKTVSGTTHNWEFRPVGNNVEVLADDVLQHTVVGQNFGGAGKVEINSSPPSDTHGFFVDNVQKYSAGTALADLDARIETDTSGKPSGTPVTNGTLIIPATSVGSSYNQIIAAFATAPALTASVVYHLVVKQAGGDVNNHYLLRKNTAGGYASGSLETSTDSGATWSEVAAEDLWFKLWTTLPSSINIDIAMSYNETHYGAV